MITTGKTHETVGWRFRGLGGIYRCTRYVRSQGFWMRLLEKDMIQSIFLDRKVGEEVCVSERAIGRTYHRLWQDNQPESHVQPCECYVCRWGEP